jgi:L-alanine-DL-glutamate epimerase-like enolase superfamily enzyme
MKITDLTCTVIGGTPIVRITTDEGISGLGPVESYKLYIKSHVFFYRDLIVGEDPTNVEGGISVIWPSSSGWPSMPTCIAS